MPGRRIHAQQSLVSHAVLNNVDFIMNLDPDELHEVHDGRTLLEWAVASGSVDVADYLIGTGADAAGVWALAEHYGTLQTLAAVFQAHGIVDGW